MSQATKLLAHILSKQVKTAGNGIGIPKIVGEGAAKLWDAGKSMFGSAKSTLSQALTAKIPAEKIAPTVQMGAKAPAQSIKITKADMATPSAPKGPTAAAGAAGVATGAAAGAGTVAALGSTEPGLLEQGVDKAKELGGQALDGAKSLGNSAMEMGGKAVDWAKQNPLAAGGIGIGAVGLLSYLLMKRRKRDSDEE